MTHCQNNDYWDALLAGERRPISPERLPLATTRRGTNSNALLTVDQLNLQSFHRRDPQQRLRQPVNWNQAVPYLELEIRGTDDDKHTTAFSAQTGLTTSSYWKPGDPELSDITLRLNPRLLFPLIGLSLVENERLAQQFYVAVTLCHEYAVSPLISPWHQNVSKLCWDRHNQNWDSSFKTKDYGWNWQVQIARNKLLAW